MHGSSCSGKDIPDKLYRFQDYCAIDATVHRWIHVPQRGDILAASRVLRLALIPSNGTCLQTRLCFHLSYHLDSGRKTMDTCKGTVDARL